MCGAFGEYAHGAEHRLPSSRLLGQLATGYTATRYVAEFRASDPARAGRIIATLALVSGGMGVVVAAGLFFGAPWVASTVLSNSQG